MGVDNRGVTVFLGNTGNPSISNREVTGDPSFTAFRVIVSVETLQILSPLTGSEMFTPDYGKRGNRTHPMIQGSPFSGDPYPQGK